MVKAKPKPPWSHLCETVKWLRSGGETIDLLLARCAESGRGCIERCNQHCSQLALDRFDFVNPWSLTQDVTAATLHVLSLLLHVSWQKLQIDKLTQDQALTNASRLILTISDYIWLSRLLWTSRCLCCSFCSSMAAGCALGGPSLPRTEAGQHGVACQAVETPKTAALIHDSMTCKQCNLFGFERRVQGTIQRSLRVSAWTFGCLHFTYYSILEGLVRYQVVFSTSLNSLSRSSRGIISCKWQQL